MRIDKTTWVCQLPKEKQRRVLDMVSQAVDCADCIEWAMCSRVCDLEDTIDIKQLLES